MTKLMQDFWETAYLQNIGKLLGICYRYVRNKQIAEDLAHDAFLKAIDKVSGFEGRGHFDAWLRKIVVNEALMYLREKKQQEAQNAWMLYEAELAAREEEIFADNFTLEELLNAVNQLPHHHKLVFNLYVIDKFSHAEIAHELGISEGTSKSHLGRARKKVRAILQAKQDRKRAYLPFILSFKLYNIDSVYGKAFRNFEVAPDNLLKLGVGYSVPATFRAAPVISASFVSSAVLIGGIAAGLAIILVLSKQEPVLELKEKASADSQAIQQMPQKIINPVHNQSYTLKDFNINASEIYDTTSATISDNAIIPDENKTNNTEMKRLSTVGALLIAGASMGFDSSGNQDLKTTQQFKLPEIQLGHSVDGMIMQRKEGDGVFKASAIIWSSANHHVYMKGEQMKAQFEKDKFSATGTVSFLGEVSFLLLDGQEVTFDKDIKLSDKQYSIKSLSISGALRKYGSKGKNGAVEINSL